MLENILVVIGKNFITFTKNNSMRQRHYWLNVTKKDANNVFFMPPGNAESENIRYFKFLRILKNE